MITYITSHLFNNLLFCPDRNNVLKFGLFLMKAIGAHTGKNLLSEEWRAHGNSAGPAEVGQQQL